MNMKTAQLVDAEIVTSSRILRANEEGTEEAHSEVEDLPETGFIYCYATRKYPWLRFKQKQGPYPYAIYPDSLEGEIQWRLLSEDMFNERRESRSWYYLDQEFSEWLASREVPGSEPGHYLMNTGPLFESEAGILFDQDGSRMFNALRYSVFDTCGEEPNHP